MKKARPEVKTDDPKLVVSDEPAPSASAAVSSAQTQNSGLAEMSADEFLKLLDEGSAEQLLELSKVDEPEHATTPAKLPWFREALAVPDGERTVPAIFMWWEGRRMPYNALVAFCGLPFAFALLHFMPFMFVVLGVVGYGISANVCYTLGPLAEIVVSKLFGIQRSKRLAPELLALGTIFSLLVTIGGGILTLLLYMHGP
jgi:hypothetical protein